MSGSNHTKRALDANAMHGEVLSDDTRALGASRAARKALGKRKTATSLRVNPKKNKCEKVDEFDFSTFLRLMKDSDSSSEPDQGPKSSSEHAPPREDSVADVRDECNVSIKSPLEIQGMFKQARNETNINVLQRKLREIEEAVTPYVVPNKPRKHWKTCNKCNNNMANRAKICPWCLDKKSERQTYDTLAKRLARKKFKEWFDECIEPDDPAATHPDLAWKGWLSQNGARSHYKSWCKAKKVPEADCFSDRCSKACKKRGCPLETCPRFLVHMCDALNCEKYSYDKSMKCNVRTCWKTDGGSKIYKAYFKHGKADILEMGGTSKPGRAKFFMVKKATYKNA